MKNDLLTGKPVKSIILFALPIMASSMLQYNYNLVDNIIVGRYIGTDALAAVGSVGAINSFIIGTALGLTSGFTITVAQSFGAGDKKRMNKYAGNSISLALLIGIIIVIVAHILCVPLLRLLRTPDNIIDMAASYLNILYFAVPIQMMLNNFNALSRAVGESKKPLYFLIVSVIINLCLDLLFVAHFKWGVIGAAWATNISQLTAAVLAGIDILKHNKQLDIKISDIRLDAKTSWNQLKMGIPISLQFTITSVGSMCLQGAVNGFGANVIAGFTAAGRVEQLLNIPMSGLGVGTMTFVSQNYGARNYDRIIKSVRNILLIDLAVSVVCSIILVLVGPSVVTLFMTEYNEEIMFAAKHYLRAIALCYSLVAVLFVFRNTLQGLGFTYANTIAGAGELFGRLAIALLFTPLIGFDAVCYAGPAAWLLADIPLVIIYLKKRNKFKILSLKGD
ncbi:MAG: MATE family efflux transporter [Clostridium sp.]|nr:MATE family efflux transporter [Clostridium sp.]